MSNESRQIMKLNPWSLMAAIWLGWALQHVAVAMGGM
jgi:hypothetical protein